MSARCGQRFAADASVAATLNWCSVLADGGKYRVWYECYDADGWYTGDDSSFCYAESQDGVRWQTRLKPTG